MTRHELNDVFATTSFLQGANAAYLEQLHASYQQAPDSVGPEWQAFFASLRDDRDDVLFQARGPSWKPSSGLEGKVLAPAAFTQEQALDAARDTLAARMLIRNFRTRGHLIAKLDPLELSTRKEHPELRPKTYGFTKADYDRPIYLGGALGLQFGTLRQVLDILKRVYAQHIGT